MPEHAPFRPALPDTASRSVKPRSFQPQPPALRPSGLPSPDPSLLASGPLLLLAPPLPGLLFRPAPSKASPLLPDPPLPPPRFRALDRPFQPISLQAPPLARPAATRGNAPRAQRWRTRCSVMGFQLVRPDSRPCPRDSTPPGSGPLGYGPGVSPSALALMGGPRTLPREPLRPAPAPALGLGRDGHLRGAVTAPPLPTEPRPAGLPRGGAADSARPGPGLLLASEIPPPPGHSPGPQ